MKPLAKVLGYAIPLASSFIILIPLTWNYIFINGFIDGAGLYYPYDVPSLTFFAAGIILFLKKKWIWFYPVFLLACLNRESACFITLSVFFLNLKLRDYDFISFIKLNKGLIIHVIAQTSIWIVLRITLSYIFRNNPGEFFEEPHSMLEFISKIASGETHWAMNNPRWFLSIFFGIWIVPLIMKYNLNGSLKRILLVGFVYLLILVFRSNMMETRVYNELNVILTICAICLFFPNHRYKNLV